MNTESTPIWTPLEQVLNLLSTADYQLEVVEREFDRQTANFEETPPGVVIFGVANARHNLREAIKSLEEQDE